MSSLLKNPIVLLVIGVVVGIFVVGPMLLGTSTSSEYSVDTFSINMDASTSVIDDLVRMESCEQEFMRRGHVIVYGNEPLCLIENIIFERVNYYAGEDDVDMTINCYCMYQ